MDGKNILIALLAHVSLDPLSDGNTRIVVRGRIKLLRIILRSLRIFNATFDSLPILILDTGDLNEEEIISSIREFGFTRIITPVQNGFDIAAAPLNENRTFIRYKRTASWSTEFKDRARRFIESCHAALIYAKRQNISHVIAIEGDTVLFGEEYLSLLVEKLVGATLATCSEKGRLYTDFWAADVQKALAAFPSVFEFMQEPPYHPEIAFAKTFKNRHDLSDLIVGEKSLDQKIRSQRNEKKLSEIYFRQYPYAWITHPSKRQIEQIDNYLDELSGVEKIKQTSLQAMREWVGNLIRYGR